MKIKELLVIHHSHMDVGYTHPQPVVWAIHDRCIDEAIDLCERTAEYPEGSQCKWTCEVTNVVLHWLETAPPRQVERLRALVAAGRISIGPMLCHWTALHPEDLLRESLQPMLRLREVLGVRFSAAMQTDVNGVPWSTPDLLLDAGVGNLMMSINIHMGGFPLSRPLIFRWRTPGGREMTVYSGEHYNAFGREAGLGRPDAPLAAAEKGLNHYFERLRDKGWRHDFAILTATHPIMDDNGPPNPELPEFVRRWNAAGKTPFIRIATVDEVFRRIARLPRTKLPVHSGDWTDFWTNGVGASALDVVMSRRAHGALWGARALATLLPDAARERAARICGAAVEKLHLANEHTWTTYASTGALGVAGSGKIEPVPLAEQCVWKSEKCAGSLSLARMARRDALDDLAGNPAQSRSQEGLLVFNPAGIPRQVMLRMTPDVAGGASHLVAGTKHRLDVVEDVLRDTAGTAWYGPVEIGPHALKRIRLPELKPRNFSSGVTASAGEISSRFWRLRFHPETGRVTSLVHRVSGRECFDPDAGFDLFGPVHESVAQPSERSRSVRDPRYDLFHVTEANFDEVVHSDVDAWATGWNARHQIPEAAVRVETLVDADGVRLVRHLELRGVRGAMQQTLTLPAYEDRVCFEAFFNKADETDPESLYFTFPFKLDRARAHFDTAGVSVAYDGEQLPGACRDWFTAGTYVAVEGRGRGKSAGGCLTLACPDAPLFQLGGFHYARRQRDVSGVRQALVVAWATNNYWDTNFKPSQPGPVRFRYELACTPSYDPASSARFAAAAARPVVFHPVARLDDALPAPDLVGVLPRAVTLVALTPDGPHAILAGFRNHARRPVALRPGLPGRRPSAVVLVDALGRPLRNLSAGRSVSLPARRTTWIRFEFNPAP